MSLRSFRRFSAPIAAATLVVYWNAFLYTSRAHGHSRVRRPPAPQLSSAEL